MGSLDSAIVPQIGPTKETSPERRMSHSEILSKASSLLKTDQIRYGGICFAKIPPMSRAFHRGVSILQMTKHRKFQVRAAIGTMAACAIGLVGVNWDLEISRHLSSMKIPGDLRKAIGLSETFGHSSGSIVIFTALLWIDVKNRSKLWRAALFTLICGIASNAAKVCIPRHRPHSLGLSETEIVSSWQTWGSPLTGSWFEEQFRSFPSGHSATAVALAIGLSQVYPRGRWIFAFLAAMACLQRLESRAHFLSDIMGGVVISLVLSIWYWRPLSSLKSDCDGELLNSTPQPSLLTTE